MSVCVCVCVCLCVCVSMCVHCLILSNGFVPGRPKLALLFTCKKYSFTGRLGVVLIVGVASVLIGVLKLSSKGF